MREALRRIAVLDIGTNTILLLVAEVAAGGAACADAILLPVYEDCRFVRLGQGLGHTGRLAPEAIARGIDAITAYRSKLDELGVEQISAIGTQALREAKNSAEFVAPAEAILRAPIETIAGEREAELVNIAVTRSFPELVKARFVTADVGGGSTEIIVSEAGRVVAAESLPIGSVRLSERHISGDLPKPREIEQLFADIDSVLDGYRGGATVPEGVNMDMDMPQQYPLPTGVPLVATAGTATTMAAVSLQLANYDPARVQGVRMGQTDVDRILSMFTSVSLAERRQLIGLEEQRADVIIGGAAILARLVHRLNAPEMIISDRGIRWGRAYELAVFTV